MRTTVFSVLVASVLVFGCGQRTEMNQPVATSEPTSVTADQTAVAELQFAPGVDGSGTVTFTSSGQGVRLVAEVQGVAPGEHGFHLHEMGECTPPDFTSAGDHFNPTGAQHGGADAEPRHAGDFGNLTVGADGTGRLELTVPDLSVEPGPNSVLDRAVVLHAQPDDLKTQPTGGSGGRIACGVVRMMPTAPQQM